MRRVRRVTAAMVAALCFTNANAAYVHDDPAGIAHPGCIRSSPPLVRHSRGGIASANQSCPGAPMTDVWDFDTDLYPFNLERARDTFDSFWPANNLVESNDFNRPTFSDYVEPGNPPRRHTGYTWPGTKFWRYKFLWQTSVQSKPTHSFNMDIALEQINATIVKELPKMMEYLAENDCDTIDTSTLTTRLDSAMRDDFDRSMRYRFGHHSWRCAGYHSCDVLTPPETTLGYLNDELDRLMTARNRTLERAHLDAYKSQTGRPTGDYSFLNQYADDVDTCIEDLSAFNLEVTKQVRSEYAAQQAARFQTFLEDAKYDDVVNPSDTPYINISSWNENIPRVNQLVETEIKKRWVRDFNENVTDWTDAKGALYDSLSGLDVTTVSPDMTHLNSLIETQVASNWISAANDEFEEWKTSQGLVFLRIDPITSRNPGVAAMNADSKTQAESDWVSRASSNLTSYLSANGYTYVDGVAIYTVSEDIDALNADVETQVKAEWVRNAQNDFYGWLIDKAYTEDVSNATASITSVTQSISSLNSAVEAVLQAAHVTDSQNEFQQWLTSKSYAYVTGVSIDEVNEDIAAVNAEVETQVKARWVSDADAALQQWLAQRGLQSAVSVSIGSVTDSLSTLNDAIETQTVDDWVSTENAAVSTWLNSQGYDSLVSASDVSLDGSDAAARSGGYPGYPLSVNGVVKAEVEADWISTASADLTNWLASKNYNTFVTSSDVAITTTSPNVANINAVVEGKAEAAYVTAIDAELQQWLTANGYSDVSATVDDVNENFAVLNANIENQAKDDWVNDADDELDAFLTANGFGYVTGVSVGSVSEDIDALNAAIETQVNSQWVTDTNALLQTWVQIEGYASLASGSIRVTNTSPDFAAINADLESSVKADYVTSVNTEINQWVVDNEFEDYFVASSDKLMDTDDVAGDIAAINANVVGKMEAEWVTETDAEFQQWLSSEFGSNVTDASTLEITAADQDFDALNSAVEALARSKIPDLGDYEPFEPVAFEGFVAFEVAEEYSYDAYAPDVTSAPHVPTFSVNVGAFGTYVDFAPSTAYPAYVDFALTDGAYPGYVAHTITSAFPDLSASFTWTAFSYDPFVSGTSYATYVPFVLPNGAYPGFVEFALNAFQFNAFTLAAYPTYVDFENSNPYPTYAPFSMVPAFSHEPYVHLREHSFTPYALRTPNHPRWWSDRYDRFWITDPKHIDKHDMSKLFYYHKAWYYQEYSRCHATCVGTMGPNTEVDTDFLAPDRVCDSDDHICPTSNTPSPAGTNNDGTWEEFNLILTARVSHIGKHPSCPVSDPCRTSPPPCFYVTSECIPDVVVDTRVNNTALRTREDIQFNEDEKYLHEPMKVSDIVEWKLVSGRLDRPGAPKLWNYWTGLDMAPFTSPRDNQKYHKVCTFALVERNPSRFERGVEYGFSIAEQLRKDDEGHTAEWQNSYRAPNHVYDVGHVGDIERWQRSFGETVSPLLNNDCSGRFASQWRNRRYSPAQQFGSVSKVWGTCADTCAALSTSNAAADAMAEATLGVTQIVEPKHTITAVRTKTADLGSARMGNQSIGHVDTAHLAVAGALVLGIAALAVVVSKRTAVSTELAAEKIPLIAKNAAGELSLDIN